MGMPSPGLASEAASRACSDSTPVGRLPSPLQSTPVALASPPEPVSLIVYPQLRHEA